jgi:hypothetical protein
MRAPSAFKPEVWIAAQSHPESGMNVVLRVLQALLRGRSRSARSRGSRLRYGPGRVPALTFRNAAQATQHSSLQTYQET